MLAHCSRPEEVARYGVAWLLCRALSSRTADVGADESEFRLLSSCLLCASTSFRSILSPFTCSVRSLTSFSAWEIPRLRSIHQPTTSATTTTSQSRSRIVKRKRIFYQVPRLMLESNQFVC